jgi:phosphatidylserine/phosphatidylglycerophosphate/cardiolipin synthase-like enzyme
VGVVLVVYLICNKCKNYYELQLDESPEDFDLDCKCGGKLELKDIFTQKGFTDDKPPIKFTKKDLDFIEKIRTYRSNEILIKKLSLENKVLKEKNSEIINDFIYLNKELIDRDKLINQIRELKREKKDLKQELVENREKYKFVVTTSDSVTPSVYGEIRKNLSEAKNEVLVCSPWITHLVDEFKGFSQGITIKIITNFRKEDVERGITDADKLRALHDLGAEIRYNNNLHAKMVFVDGKTVIISSANLTKRGLSVNYEAGAVIKDREKVQEAVKFFDNVWKESETLTPELVRRYV